MIDAKRLLVAFLLLILSAGPAIAQPVEDEFAIGPNIEKADFFREGLAPVRKAGPYDITIVYFMDYQCPVCRRYTPDVARAVAEDRRVRVIYRDTPIFGPRSEAAARAAIASQFQGKHAAFHSALMLTKGQLDEAALRAAATKAEIDWARLERDLARRGEAIDLQIARNLDLSLAAGISGTPAFLIGETLANGALDYKALKAEIADARRAGKTAQAAAPIKPATAKPAATDADTSPPLDIAEPAVAAEAETPLAPAPPPFDRAVARDKAGADAVATDTPPSRWWWLGGLAILAAIAGLWAARRRRSQ